MLDPETEHAIHVANQAHAWLLHLPNVPESHLTLAQRIQQS